MSEAPSPSSGQRFAHDLHRIREDRGVSLEELHEETKIPLGLLEQFEASGLFDHPMFNRVYLRSLVRTYARKVGLPIDTALDMLDRALAGDYAGELAAEYFGESVEPMPGVDPNPGHVAEVVQAIRSEGAGAILQEEYYPSSTSDRIATLTDCDLVVLDGGTDVSVGETYLEHLQHIADAIYEALSD